MKMTLQELTDKELVDMVNTDMGINFEIVASLMAEILRLRKESQSLKIMELNMQGLRQIVNNLSYQIEMMIPLENQGE